MKRGLAIFALWSVLSMADKAIYWWHWGKWPLVCGKAADILCQGLIHGLAWTGVWMMLDALLTAVSARSWPKAVMAVSFGCVVLFEIGEVVCSSRFHVYMGGEWLVMLMTSSWDELKMFFFIPASNTCASLPLLLASYFAVDVTIHCVIGWGMSEPWVFAPHWIWMLPILAGQRVMCCGKTQVCGVSALSDSGRSAFSGT